MPLLGDANAVLLGGIPVDSIYARGTKVWPTGMEYPPGIVGERWTMQGFAPVVEETQTFPETGWATSWVDNQLTITIAAPVLYLDPFGLLLHSIGGFTIPAFAANPHPRVDPNIPENALGLFYRWNISSSIALGTVPASYEVVMIWRWQPTSPTTDAAEWEAGFMLNTFDGDALGWQIPMVLPEFQWLPMPPDTRIIKPGYNFIFIWALADYNAPTPAQTLTFTMDQCEWAYGNGTLEGSLPPFKLPARMQAVSDHILALDRPLTPDEQNVKTLLEHIGRFRA